MGTYVRALTDRDISNEYQHMIGFRCFFNNLCILVLWTNVAIALEGLKLLKVMLNLLLTPLLSLQSPMIV